MSYEEKRNWVFLLVTAGVYAGYVLMLLGRAGDGPLTEVAYLWPLLAAIAIAIAANIVGTILASMTALREAGQTDERDAGIHRKGEVVGYYSFSIGIVGVLALAIAEVPHFWIGNAIYLAFVVASLIATTVKLVAYRRGC